MMNENDGSSIKLGVEEASWMIPSISIEAPRKEMCGGPYAYSKAHSPETSDSTEAAEIA
jgi:hypothetical protein